MEFYQHSGRCGPVGVPFATAAGLLAGALGGLVYAYVVNWIPFIFVSFIATIGFGIAVGAAVAGGARLGKMRSMAITSAIALLVGAAALYFAWVFDPMARVEDVHEPFWRLEAIWAYMKFGYAVGFWGLGDNGDAVTGPFLAFVWVVEGGIVVGASLVTVRTLLGERPFCEETEQWTTAEANVARLSLSDDPQAESKLQRLLEGDLSSLTEFYRGEDGDPVTLRFDLATCPDCPACNFLTVSAVQLVVDKKGETSEKVEKLLVNLRITPDDVASVRSAGVDRPVPPEEPGESLAADASPPTQDG